jgi:hypothetical protein
MLRSRSLYRSAQRSCLLLQPIPQNSASCTRRSPGIGLYHRSCQSLRSRQKRGHPPHSTVPISQCPVTVSGLVHGSSPHGFVIMFEEIDMAVRIALDAK